MGISDQPARPGEGPLWRWPRQRAGLRAQLADPLLRNGYALMANTGVTGLLGMLYWLLAARLYPPADVGRASAAYVAMNLLAGIAALSFQGALTRFIPQAGQGTRRLVARAYAISIGAAVSMTLLLLLLVNRLGASYSELAGVTAGAVFILCVGAWVVFTLQDSVLTGLRSASWVLGENAAFGVVKIALVTALAAVLPGLGIYVSWMLPVFVAVPFVNALIFGKLVPRHAMLTTGRPPPTTRQIGRFLAGDYTGALAALATTNLVPLLVMSRLEPRATAYFFMAWAVGGVLQLLGVNMATSLTVEGAFDPSTLGANCRAALRRMAMIMVPCVAAVILLARWGLGLFGARYATYGAPVLIFMALGMLPEAAVEIYLGVLRAQSRTGRVAFVQAVRCAAILLLALLLTIRLGTAGAGVAFLVSQCAVAVMISPSLWQALTGRAARAGRQPADIEVGLDLITDLRTVPARYAGAAVLGTIQVLDVSSSPPRVPPPPPSSVPVEPLAPLPPTSRPRAGTGRGRARWPAWLPLSPTPAAVGAVAAAGFVLFFWYLRGVDLPHMNGLGLISVLPPGSLAGVVLLSLALVAGIVLPRAHPALLGTILAALVVCLDGVTAVAEAQPRFPTAYQIAGFVDFVARHGYAAPGLQAYFSWPGFFAFVAYLAGAAGQHSLLTLLRVWPVGIDLLCLPPLFLIMRNLRMSWRARWLAGFFFAVGNWVGQDYFSPQAFNYLLYLVFVAICVNWFAGPPCAGGHRGAAGVGGWLASRPWPRWLPWPDWLHVPAAVRPRRLHWRLFGTLEPGEQVPRTAGTGQRALLLVLLIGIYAVAVTSHQLSPFYMFGACGVLVAVRRSSVPGLWLLLGVMLTGWVSFATVAYWSGHMSNVFGDFGNVLGNLSLSTGGRVTGTDPLHRLALQTRELVAAAVMLLAFLGAARRRLHHLDDRILIALLVMPVPSIAIQNYGGEMVLRIYLFMLPAGAILAALFFFPDPQQARLRWRWIPAVALCAAVLPLGFLVARYGNEAFERTPTGELTAVNYVYGHTQHGGRVLWVSPAPATDDTPQMPWSYRDIANVEFVPVLAPTDPARTAGLAAALHRDGPGTYLVIPSTQLLYLHQADGYPADWGQRLRAALAATRGVRVAFRDSTAVVYTARLPKHAVAHPPAIRTSQSGPATRSTVWTPAGLAVLWLLLAALTVREFTRICSPAATRLTRTLTAAAWPLLVALGVIVVIRFLVL